jgi:hypothetical protein
MYLFAKKYISGFTEWDEDRRMFHTNPTADAIKEAAKITDACESKDCGVTLQFPVAYWRKANHIHGWFVENVQDNKDDCDEYYVSRANLENLRSTCQNILTTKDTDILPRVAGFFFGSNEVDESYWYAVENTVKQLDKVLSLPDDISLYYQSSW